jgi:hypothetical protein
MIRRCKPADKLSAQPRQSRTLFAECVRQTNATEQARCFPISLPFHHRYYGASHSDKGLDNLVLDTLKDIYYAEKKIYKLLECKQKAKSRQTLRPINQSAGARRNDAEHFLLVLICADDSEAIETAARLREDGFRRR